MKSRRRRVEPVETDEMTLGFSPTRSQILKGWHDVRQTNDTPSGLITCQTRSYNHSTPSEFLDHVLGCSMKHEDAFQNTHLGRIER